MSAGAPSRKPKKSAANVDWDLVMDRLRAGDSANAICRDPDPRMPSPGIWTARRAQHPDFAKTVRSLSPPGAKGRADGDEVARRVLERVAGGESLATICASPGMPSHSWVALRARAHPSFRTSLEAAKAKGGFTLEKDEAAWDRLVALVRAGAQVSKVAGRNGLPTHGQWILRRRRDPEFKARAVEALRATPHRGIEITEARWNAAIDALAKGRTRLEALSAPGLPTYSSVVARMKAGDDIGERLRQVIGQHYRAAVPRAPSVRATPDALTRALRAVENGHAPGALRDLGLPSPVTIWKARKADPIFDAKFRSAISARAVYRGLGAQAGGHLMRHLSQNELFAAVDGVIGRGLEAHVRDDIRSEMILAVLGGEMSEADITRETARAFVSDYHRGAGTWSSRSLDAPAFGDSNRTMHDTMSA